MLEQYLPDSKFNSNLVLMDDHLFIINKQDSTYSISAQRNSEPSFTENMIIEKINIGLTLDYNKSKEEINI